MSPEPRNPSEFVDFVRDIGVRSFDYFASRVTDERSPFHKLALYWSELERDQKSKFFDQLITGAQALAATAVVNRISRSRVPPAPVEKAEPAAPKKSKKKSDKKEEKKADSKKPKNKDKKGKKKKTKKSAGFEKDAG